MLGYKKTLVTCSLIISLAASPFSAFAATVDRDPNKQLNEPEAMIVDALFARPVGIVATVTGTVVYLVSLPFSALGGNTDEAWNSLVAAPAEFTFQRPLGEHDR